MSEKESTSECRERLSELEKELESLKAKLEEAENRAQDYLNQLKYMKADFENYKKRVAREREDELNRRMEGFILSLLEVVDNLERAIEMGKKSRKKKPLLEGIELVHRQLLQALAREGVEEIPALGKSFNPYEHECVAVEEASDCEDEEIIEVYQKGYKFKGRVIRSSKVKIAKKR